MKVAFLAAAYLHDATTGIDGAQVQLHNLSHALAARGLDVHYISATGDRTKPACETVRGVHLRWVQMARPRLRWRWHLRAFFERLDQIQPDVVYQRGRSELTYVAARWAARNRRRFVWATNGEDSAELWRAIRRLLSSRRSRLRKALLLPGAYLRDALIHRGMRGAHVVVNQTAHQQERSLLCLQKHGVVLPSYFPGPPDPGNGKRDVVLWVGNLWPVKQPEVFIELARACLRLPAWEFRLVGGCADSRYAEQLRCQAAQLPNCRLVGAVAFEEGQRHFAEARLLVNTSRPGTDGLPNAMVQAWLHASAVASLHPNPNGWLTERSLGYHADGSRERLLAAVTEALASRSELEAIGSRARRFALEQFASEEILDRYIEVLGR